MEGVEHQIQHRCDPRYMLIDKDGHIVNNQYYFGSNDKLKFDLLQLARKENLNKSVTQH